MIKFYSNLHSISQSCSTSPIKRTQSNLSAILMQISVLRLKCKGCKIGNDWLYPETLDQHLIHTDSESTPHFYQEKTESLPLEKLGEKN